MGAKAIAFGLFAFVLGFVLLINQSDIYANIYLPSEVVLAFTMATQFIILMLIGGGWITMAKNIEFGLTKVVAVVMVIILISLFFLFSLAIE